MADISKLSRLVNGVSRQVDLSTNTLVVDNIKLKLGGANYATVSGSLTAVRTITMPNADVNLGHIANLNTLSGVSAGATDLGTFTGTTIADTSTIKAGLQALETATETNATNISNHLSDATDAHDASAISNIPSGNLAATDQQTVNNELQSDIDSRALASDLTNHLNDTADAHDASAISNIPSGNLAATDQQAVNNELQSDIDSRALDSAVIKKDGSVTYTSNQAMGNNKITGLLAGSGPNDAVNKAQLDGVAVGALWLNPIIDPNLINDSLATPPGSPVIGDTYIAGATATGAWATFDGYAFMWNGTSWVDLLGRAVIAGDRFGVSMESATVGAGGLASKDDQLAQVVVATPGSITYTFTIPTISNAVYVNNANSYHTGHQYDYTATGWVEFGGLNAVSAGIGLSYSGNVLSINMGAGIVQLPSDEVGVDVHTAGGLFTTVDNSASSTLTGAQLAIKLDGSTLAKSSSGLKLTDTAVTPNPYGSASVVPTFTVNAQGRLTAAADATISITASQVSDFTEASQDAVGTILTNTTSVSLAYNDGLNTISATVLPAGVDHDSLNNFVANKHIDHSAVSIATAAATSGLSGGGNITATRNLVVDIAGTTAKAVPVGADEVLINDIAGGALKKATIQSIVDGKNKYWTLVAGENMAANVTFAVRFALTGETAERVYKADYDASVSDKYYVVGLVLSTGAITAGDSISVLVEGEHTLGASDVAFASGEVGQPVHLLGAGAWDANSQITYTTDQASFKIGMVKATNKIWFKNMQLNGIN